MNVSLHFNEVIKSKISSFDLLSRQGAGGDENMRGQVDGLMKRDSNKIDKLIKKVHFRVG